MALLESEVVLLVPCSSTFLFCPPMAAIVVDDVGCGADPDTCDVPCNLPDPTDGFGGAMPSWCVEVGAGEVAIVVEVVLAMLGLDFFFDESEEF